jgi:hypothetical protein
VPALQAQVLDVSAGGLRDSQPVQREQRDQRMLERRPEPGGHQQRAEFVTVQRRSMRLVVQRRPPDVGGRGMVHELFFDGVLVELPGRVPRGQRRSVLRVRTSAQGGHSRTGCCTLLL